MCTLFFITYKNFFLCSLFLRDLFAPSLPCENAMRRRNNASLLHKQIHQSFLFAIHPSQFASAHLKCCLQLLWPSSSKLLPSNLTRLEQIPGKICWRPPGSLVLRNNPPNRQTTEKRIPIICADSGAFCLPTYSKQKGMIRRVVGSAPRHCKGRQ